MFCRNCGQELPDGTKFCTDCGAQTAMEAQQAQQQTPPVQPAPPVMNQSYQMPMMPPKKKFPAWAIVLIVIGAIIGVALIGIVATTSSKQNISTAKEFIQNGDYDAAKGLIEEELNYSYNDSVELYILLADCYLGQNDYNGALLVLESAKEDVDDTQEIEAKINEIKQTYSAQIEADKKAEEEAKKKAEEEAKKKAEEEAKQKAEEQKQQEQQKEKEKQDYIKSCQTVSYKDLLRNPDNYKGQKIKITVEIVQIMSGGIFTDGGYRAYEDYDLGEGDTWMSKEWYIKGKEEKILKDDVVVFYGEYTGTVEVKRALTGVKEEVPCLDFKYYSIIGE